MTAIPEDVTDKAREALMEALTAARSKSADDGIAVVSRLLMAERRRCALIARQWQESSFKDEKFAANSIADKIMAGAA